MLVGDSARVDDASEIDSGAGRATGYRPPFMIVTWVVGLFIVFCAVVIVLTWHGYLTAEQANALVGLVGAFGVFILSGSAMLVLFIGQRRLRRTELRVASDVAALSIKRENAVSLSDYVLSTLEEAGGRQRLLAISAEARLQTLYTTWLGLTAAAVVAPIVMIFLYAQTDKLAQAEEAKKLGLTGAEIAVLAGRDWHLLLVGASFGLLLLGASRGVLLAESKQREAYFRLTDPITYYGDLARYLRIAVKAETDKLATGPTREAIGKIQESLLANTRRTEQSDDDADLKDDTATELAKAIAAVVARKPS